MSDSGTVEVTQRAVLGDLPPLWQLVPFLAVTGLLMWWLGRKLKLPPAAWLAIWGFFAVVGTLDLRRGGALSLWLMLGGLAGIYGQGWRVARRLLD